MYDKSNPKKFRQHRASIAQAKTSSDTNIIPQSEKIISTPILFKDKNSLFKFDLPVNIDSNGNWVVNVSKTKKVRPEFKRTPLPITLYHNLKKILPLIKIVINKVLELCFKNPTMNRGLRVIHITKLN